MNGMASARICLIAVTLAFAWSLTAVVASAQTGKNFDVKTMNFDLWCQETQKLPPDRCDRRTAEDEAQFDAYRDSVEKYELTYLKRKQTDQNLSRVVTHADPSPNEDPARHPTDKDIASPRPNP